MKKQEWSGMVKGIVVAASWLVRYHGEETYAKEMLSSHGITRAEARKMGCEDYDMEPLIENKCF